MRLVTGLLAVTHALARDARPATRRQMQDSPCANLNADGEVDVADLLLLLAAFGVHTEGDTNADGATDVTDLLALLAVFGSDSCTPGAPSAGAVAWPHAGPKPSRPLGGRG